MSEQLPLSEPPLPPATQILPPGVTAPEGALTAEVKKPGRGRPKKAAGAVPSKALAVPDEKVAELTTKREELANDLRQVQNWPLDTQEQADVLTEVCQKAKAEQEEYEAQQKKITDPLDEAKRQIKALFGPPIEYLKSIRAAGKTRLEGRLQAQRNEQRAALAAVQEAGGRVDAATMAVATGSSFVKPTEGSYEVETWTFEVTDPSQVPAQFWMLNDTALKHHATEHKGEAERGSKQVPGVRFFSTRRLVIRGQ